VGLFHLPLHIYRAAKRLGDPPVTPHSLSHRIEMNEALPDHVCVAVEVAKGQVALSFPDVLHKPLAVLLTKVGGDLELVLVLLARKAEGRGAAFTGHQLTSLDSFLVFTPRKNRPRLGAFGTRYTLAILESAPGHPLGGRGRLDNNRRLDGGRHLATAPTALCHQRLELGPLPGNRSHPFQLARAGGTALPGSDHGVRLRSANPGREDRSLHLGNSKPRRPAAGRHDDLPLTAPGNRNRHGAACLTSNLGRLTDGRTETHRSYGIPGDIPGHRQKAVGWSGALADTILPVHVGDKIEHRLTTP